MRRWLWVVFLFVGCSMPQNPDRPSYFLTAQNKRSESTFAGNFVTSAIREVHRLDVVFYPVDLLDESKAAWIKADMSPSEVSAVVDLFPPGAPDNFFLGTMKGSDIKEFLIKRSRYRYQKDLDVAGLRYDIGFVGGFPTRAHFALDDSHPLDDDENYRVAVSELFFFSGYAFPGYKYGDGLNFAFSQENRRISAREAVENFLTRPHYAWPYVNERRAQVTQGQVIADGRRRIFEIQGAAHVSPLLMHEVITSGVVTAVGINEWFPGGMDVYIQDPEGDGVDETSDAVHVFFENENLDIQIGDELTVSGVVKEEVLNNYLGRTSIRQTQLLSKKRPQSPVLPKPVRLGVGGRPIPERHISTFQGNLNEKPYLKLSDGIDFYESLEGMRVEVHDLRIVGFRGGSEDHESSEPRPKGYLNVYFVADGLGPIRNETPRGGVFADTRIGDFNPQIMQLVANHMTNGFDPTWIFNVGDRMPGEVVGVLGFEKNIFGDGEYALVVPQSSGLNAFTSYVPQMRKSVTDLKNRNNYGSEGEKSTPLVPTDAKFTIATYNLENLAGYQDERIVMLGQVIAHNLVCPDILSLVEIQDANGQDFEGSADATPTLKKVIAAIPQDGNVQSACQSVNYDFANIDPILNTEGGQPGGNIRISILYNKNKIQFVGKNPPNARTEAVIEKDGSLNYNPARIYPNAPEFRGSRKSIVAEFKVGERKLFIIGNHLNSKLGDTSHWSAVQPPVFRSDVRRTAMANLINKFVRRIDQGSPGALVAVVGDFNAFPEEGAMVALKGEELWNLSEQLPQNARYTTNHNGNSQSLDYILSNRSLMTQLDGVEIIHINSNFMGRFSDHDPVLARFHIPF